MARIKQFDHVGITVRDLEAATAFFVALGCQIEGRMPMEGEFIDTVLGIPGAHTEIVMLQPPGGGTRLELARFINPETVPTPPDAPNEVGLRNLGFEVDDVQAIVDRLLGEGYRLLGEIGQYEDIWRMAHIRGPEGIVVSVSERIG